MPIQETKVCEHNSFKTNIDVGRLTDENGKVTSYLAEIRIQCLECGVAMQFKGLQPGLNLQGAAMSIDGLEARLAIVPQGNEPNPLDGIIHKTTKHEA